MELNSYEISNTQDDDQIRAVLALDYLGSAIKAGISWMSNLDSDVLEELSATSQNSDVSALGLYLIWSHGTLTFSAEHITALDDYAPGDFGGDVAVSSQPSATTLEAAYAIGENSTVSLAVQHSAEAAFVGLREDVVLLNYFRSLENGLDVGLELGESQDYATTNGGVGNDSSHILLRLSASF
jgi:hypothetical protein